MVRSVKFISAVIVVGVIVLTTALVSCVTTAPPAPLPQCKTINNQQVAAGFIPMGAERSPQGSAMILFLKGTTARVMLFIVDAELALAKEKVPAETRWEGRCIDEGTEYSVGVIDQVIENRYQKDLRAKLRAFLK